MRCPGKLEGALERLNSQLTGCTLCPRLVAHRERVAREKKRAYRDWDYWGKPVPGFGDPRGRLLIVGLAPAAHGANRTGRMFTGDSSGDWLYEALHRYGFANQPHSRTRDDGLKLKDCYVTAAVRCAPPGNKPTAGEVANCRRYLEAERELLPNVKIVLVLGRIAHDAWLKAADLARPAFQHGRHYRMPDGSILLCSCHPSRQNTNTGRLTRRMWYAVFEKARKLLANLPEGGSGIDRTGNLLGPGGDSGHDSAFSLGSSGSGRGGLRHRSAGADPGTEPPPRGGLGLLFPKD